MKNTNERMRLMVSFLGLLVLLSTAFSMAVMAQAEPITPEDYDGLVILEDPALLGDSEDEGKTESPATEPPVTEVPATETPTTEPTQEPEPTCPRWNRLRCRKPFIKLPWFRLKDGI